MTRRSARIASASQRATASPATRMGSLLERDECSQTPSKQATRSLATIAFSPMHQPTTPALATPLKLPMSEMHPSKVHPTTAAPSLGLKLGFTDIDYTKKPIHQATGAIQSTPSKTPLPSSEFSFRFTNLDGDRDKGLSNTAQKLMEEVRGEAAKYKAELLAQREQEKLEEAASSGGRKIRQAKGKAGRYSAAHMAQFKKMDSIANHPSAFRATPGRVTPMKGGLKRSQSKANLDEPDSVRSKKVSTRPAPSSLKKQPESPVKRVKQRLDDDVSNLRPVSRDGSFLPRPKSSGNDSVHSGIPRSQTLANLMTPTKSSLARASSVKAPTISLVKSQSRSNLSGVVASPSKPGLPSLARSSSKKAFSGLTKSMTMNNLGANNLPTHVQTPGRFDRVRSIWKKHISGSRSKSHIPQLAASPSKASLHQSIDEELPRAPLTTPGRKLERHVDFTPITKRAAMVLDSPSPTKSSIPRSKTMSRFPPSNSTADKPTNKKSSEDDVAYPDLSAYCRDIKEDTEKSKSQFPQSVPGTFTFRSDHTIRFDGTSPEGFGGAAGQASIRQIRRSILPTTRMPGSFPRGSEVSPNKENKDPVAGPGIPHGMSNKKRHRVSWDEEDEEDEGAKRAAKKLRKNPPAAEGHAIVAPRLVSLGSPNKKSSKTPHTPSPQKKRTGLSLSRLNMLARPKARK
ncbi:hypothetical protein F4677DRAFT_150047 [Hypoxylon crocopeplum]|nr:hypothetical protein F4677DRAFT_150047 [Hypoxylon crocopeplum]